MNTANKTTLLGAVFLSSFIYNPKTALNCADNLLQSSLATSTHQNIPINDEEILDFNSWDSVPYIRLENNDTSDEKNTHNTDTDKPQGAKDIVAVTYSADSEGDLYIPCGDGSIKNLTDVTNDTITDIINNEKMLSIDLDSPLPQVLILHTHATESFEENESWFSPDNNGRNIDYTKNIVSVGDIITDTLNNSGINTIHDNTLHDYPSYTGSYERSRITAQKYLDEYPSIKLVLDLHRDAIENETQCIKPLVNINDKDTAQIMIACAVGTKDEPLAMYKSNLKLASEIEKQCEKQYKGLSRPIFFDYKTYTQNLDVNSLLFEIGGHANTLEEAQNAGKLLGDVLVNVLSARTIA